MTTATLSPDALTLADKLATPRTAYSYIRFSHPDQARGDSLRRQTEGAVAYCKRKGWTLDTSLTLRDLGVSAFKGKNALVGNLGEFLKAVKSGTVKVGSVLIVESLDRISRQGIDEGYELIKSILKAGILIVTLSPEREFDTSATKSLTKGALEIQLILERAAEESETKSKRVSAAWSEKQRCAREGRQQPARRKGGRVTTNLTTALPLWLEERDGKAVVIPERKATVQRMFELAIAGYGFGRIVKLLTEEGIPSFAGGPWRKQYVAKVVSDRRAIGEYQPRKGRKPDGPAIPKHFPAVVKEEEWLAARAGASQRRHKSGRVGETPNVFAGLLRNARDGDSYIATTRLSGHRPGHPGTPQRLLVTTAYSHGRGPCQSFPLDTFERAVLSMLAEIDPADITEQAKGPDKIPLLEEALAEVEAKRSRLVDAIADGLITKVQAQAKRDELDATEKPLRVELETAQQEAAVPLSDAWEQARTISGELLKYSPYPERIAQDCLQGPLDAATPEEQADRRIRLRAALRRVVDSIWILAADRGRERLCAVQVWFKGGTQFRTYTILHRPPMNNGTGRKPGKWWATSMRFLSLPGVIDLRTRAGAEYSLPFLLDFDPEKTGEFDKGGVID